MPWGSKELGFIEAQIAELERALNNAEPGPYKELLTDLRKKRDALLRNKANFLSRGGQTP